MMESGLVEVAAKVGLAALLAGIIGAEREWTGKWAGLRTHMLIAVGSAFLTHVSVQVGVLFGQGSNAWDPGRIAAQIVSGVGFLGAGPPFPDGTAAPTRNQNQKWMATPPWPIAKSCDSSKST